MKIFLPIIVSVLISVFLTPFLTTKLFAKQNENSLNHQKEVCLASLSSFSTSVATGLQKLYAFTSQASAISNGLQQYYSNYSGKKINPQIDAYHLSNLKEIEQKTLTQIKITQQLLTSFTCQDNNLTLQIQQMQDSFVKSVNNFEDFRNAIKSYSQTFEIATFAATLTPTIDQSIFSQTQ